jgi:L-ribulokinase
MKVSQFYVLGIDFGTDSVRTLVVDASDGKELASDVFFYPRWASGKYCQPARNQFRQHPLDYIEGLETTVKNAVRKSGVDVNLIKGIGIDTTGSTPVAVDSTGTPLSLNEKFRDNPNAMFILWKDHTAVREADEINRIARSWGGVDYTKYEGGVYSSEWFWAKILHVIREDQNISDFAFSWVEHCDWMPALLTGNTDPLTLKRSRCAAGHKAMWHEEWGGFLMKNSSDSSIPVSGGSRKNYTAIPILPIFRQEIYHQNGQTVLDYIQISALPSGPLMPTAEPWAAKWRNIRSAR